jgi:hypothetical protein
MSHEDFLRHLTFTFMVSSLQGGLYVFCRAWLRCNSLEWGACIPLRGRIFLRKALLRPSQSRHSASLRLALHPKNRTLYPVQLPDLGL